MTTTFINGCGCKITIEETITDISELKNLKGNVSHLVKMSDDWRILKNDNWKHNNYKFKDLSGVKKGIS
jgi:hypothetical protein